LGVAGVGLGEAGGDVHGGAKRVEGARQIALGTEHVADPFAA
jgi:hypothetical protein